MMPVMWSIGGTIGYVERLLQHAPTHTQASYRPLIGGQLAKPHDRWPDVFTDPFWQYYPYFLPCAASAVFSAVIFCITAAFLREVRSTFPLCLSHFLTFSLLDCETESSTPKSR